MKPVRPTGRPPLEDNREYLGIRVRISPAAAEALRVEAVKTRRPMGLIVGEMLESRYAGKDAQ